MIESASRKPLFLTPHDRWCSFDFLNGPHPTRVGQWRQSSVRLGASGTHFGFVHRGPAVVSTPHGVFELQTGMYFAVPGKSEVQGAGHGFVVTRLGYRGVFHLGGPIEETGRLRYIDGCTSSLLIGPAVMGDPCLNLLHIPMTTRQTAHTHPSLRVGMIVDGGGLCRIPEGDVSLVPGMLFVIQTGGLHSFQTQDKHLRIVAWHPDSDFGPTHERHPMLNRTLVDGRPVNASGDAS